MNNTLIYHFKRELWNNKAFIWAPALIAGLILAIVIINLVLIASSDHPVSELLSHSEIQINTEDFHLNTLSLDGLLTNVDQSQIRKVIWSAFSAIFYFFYIPVLIIIFNYFLNTLHSERQDRSILFWKSLPISDTNSILAKFIFGALIGPCIMLLIFIVLQTLLMIIMTPIIMSLDGSAWNLLWKPTNPLLFWIYTIISFVLQIIWIAPIYAWCMLASSFAKKSPGLLAIIPIIILGTLEKVVSAISTGQSTSYIFSFLSERITKGFMPWSMKSWTMQISSNNQYQNTLIANDSFLLSKFTEFFTMPDVWIGLIITTGLMTAVIFMRRYRNEI